ncbi:hypothetical protein L6R53_04660 [Myxococcota bacterium]|nr:hypothetical protein [Myxococcota bacterium]
MRPVDPHQPLFPSRLDAGEDLYFRSPLGRPEPEDALLIVASDGAVEVAWPWAYLCGLAVRRLDPGRLPLRLQEAAGRTVAVVDDGHLAPDALARLIRLAVQSQPRRVVLVAPALPTPARRACRGLGLERTVTLRPSTHADDAPRLYPQRPVAASVARVLLSEVADAVRQDRGPPAVAAEPDLVPGQPGLHLVA